MKHLVYSLFSTATVLIHCITSPLWGQQSPMPLTYARPSVVPVFASRGNDVSELVYSGIKDKPYVMSRADLNHLGFPAVNVNYTFNTEEYNQSLNSQMQKIANASVALWWDRDAKGNMSDKNIILRGKYTATDAQVMQDKASQVSRLSNLGYDLLQKTYIVVYDVLGVKTYEEIYDEKDEKRRKRVEEHNKSLKPGEQPKKFEPVKRTLQGWSVTYGATVYKLKWDKEIQDNFFEKYWVDSTTTGYERTQKINAFANRNFPYEYYDAFSSEVDVVDIKRKDQGEYQRVMNELLKNSGINIQSSAMENMRKFKDFIPVANIHSAYPIRIKMGTKESLRKDTRYFIYELSKDDAGEIKRKRIGWGYVSKVAKNKKFADGDMSMSKITQKGGKAAYEGMIVEENDDLGLMLNMSLSRGNLFYKGLNIGAELNISKVGHQIGIPFFTGIHLGASVRFGGSKNINMGGIESDELFKDSLGKDNVVSTNVITKKDSLYSATNLGISIYLSREIYLTRRGNYYIQPTVGLTLSDFELTKIGKRELNASKYEESNPYNWSNVNTYWALAFGYNLNHKFSFYVQPVFNANSNVLSNNFGSIKQTQTEDTKNINKTFRNLGSAPLQWNFGCKVRF